MSEIPYMLADTPEEFERVRAFAGTALTETEQDTLDRIEAAPAAEESLRERVAVALYEATEAAEYTEWPDVTPAVQGIAYVMADAAIAVIRGTR